MENNIIFQITENDIQNEAMGKIGRKLTNDEIIIAKDGLEWGLLTDIDTVYNTIFEEFRNENGL